MAELDLAAALGAADEISVFRFAIYLADRDADNEPIANVEHWVAAGMALLADANYGVTRLPWSEGMWNSGADTAGKPPVTTKENTSVIYSYVRDADRFLSHLPGIRAFLHDYGRSTGQGAVMVEVSGENGSGFMQRAYFINSYD